MPSKLYFVPSRVMSAQLSILISILSSRFTIPTASQPAPPQILEALPNSILLPEPLFYYFLWMMPSSTQAENLSTLTAHFLTFHFNPLPNLFNYPFIILTASTTLFLLCSSFPDLFWHHLPNCSRQMPEYHPGFLLPHLPHSASLETTAIVSVKFVYFHPQATKFLAWIVASIS